MMSFCNWARTGKQPFGRGLARQPTRRSRAFGSIELLEDRSTPATLTVNTLADNTTSDAFLTLREAIDLVNAGGNPMTALGRALTSGELAQIDTSQNGFGTNDTILFDPSLEYGTITLSTTAGGELAIDSGITLTGPAGYQVIISGNNASGIFNIATGVSVNVSDLLIENGNTSFGGGIANEGTLNITESIIYDNTGVSGGGIYNAGTLNVTDSTFWKNTAGTSGAGGGIENNGGTLTVINSTFTGNSAIQGGGAIDNSAGTVNIASSTITGNIADSAGTSSGNGGGIDVEGGSVTIQNSIVAGNVTGTGSVPNDLGGMNVQASSGYNLIGDAGSAGGLTDGNNGNIVGNGGVGTIPIGTILDTAFAYNSAPTYTLEPVDGSPAIDHGSDALIPAGITTDQRGLPRISGGTVDIGAVEKTELAGPYVVTTSEDAVDGQYPTGQLTLREAVALANDHDGADTITFAPSITTVTLTNGDLLLADLALTTITGNGVTIDRPPAAPGSTDYFQIITDYIGASVTLDGLTIANGYGGTGGGITVDDMATLTVSNCTITDNSLIAGAATNGGGIYNAGTTTITNSVISGNTGAIGAGIYNLGVLSISDSTISGNVASRFAGGILNGPQGSLSISNSTISGNSAGTSGGGIVNSGTLTITNSTLSGNSATQHGGGIYNIGSTNFSATASISDTTVTGNRSDSGGTNAGTGGGIWTGAFASPLLQNTIVAGNFTGTGTTPSDLAGAAVQASSGFNLIGDSGSAGGLTNGTNGNIVGNNGVGTIPTDTILDPTLADNGGPTLTNDLVVGSPAINAGSNALIPSGITTDQRGLARISGGTVDIGAVEKTELPGPYVVDNPGDTVDGNYGPGQLTLPEAILLANDHSGPNTITFAPNITTVTLANVNLSQYDFGLVLSNPATTTITGNGVTIQRSTAAGTPDFGVFILTLNASVAFNGLTIANGDGGLGGGIYNYGTLSLNDCTISGNSAGGIFNATDGNLTVTNSTFSDNSAAGVGGAIYCNFGTLTVTNSTFSENSAVQRGGAIYDAFGTVTIADSTITGNRAGSEGTTSDTGGGMYVVGGSATIQNTIIAGNFVGTGSVPNDLSGMNVQASSSYNLIGDAGSAGGLTNGTNGNIVGNDGSGTLAITTVLDPTLADNGGPTLTNDLVVGSPAIDGGSNALIPSGVTTDQRGLPRISGGIVDIGAVEVQADLRMNVISPATAVPGDSLIYTIQVTNAGPDTITGATITDSFPAALTGARFTSSAAGGAIGNTASGSGNLNEIVTLPALSSITYTVTGTIAPGASGSLSDTATVGPTNTDPNPANNTATATTTLTPQADLSALLTDNIASEAPSATVSYRLVVQNMGPSTATGAGVTAAFPDALTGITFTAASTNDATGFTATGTSTISDTVTLPPNTSITYTITGTIAATGSGALGVTGSVNAALGTTDPNLANNTSTVSFVVVIPKTVIVGGAPSGSVNLYTLTGPGQYTPGGTVNPFGKLAVDIRSTVGDVNGDGIPDEIYVTGPGTLMQVTVINGLNGSVLIPPFTPFTGFTGGGFVAAGDFLGNGRDQIVVTPDRSGGPRVSIFDFNRTSVADGSEANPVTGLTRVANFFTLDPNFRGGVRTAVGDLNGDGVPDLVVAAGYGGGPAIVVINGTRVIGTNGFTPSDDLVGNFYGFDPSLRDGAYVAVGDVLGNGQQDLILGPGDGGPAEVEVLSGEQIVTAGAVAAIANPVAQFTPTGLGPSGSGMRVAVASTGVGDQVNVVVGAGRNMPGLVKVYPGTGFTSGSTNEPTGGEILNPYDGIALTDGTFVG